MDYYIKTEIYSNIGIKTLFNMQYFSHTIDQFLYRKIIKIFLHKIIRICLRT